MPTRVSPVKPSASPSRPARLTADLTMSAAPPSMKTRLASARTISGRGPCSRVRRNSTTSAPSSSSRPRRRALTSSTATTSASPTIMTMPFIDEMPAVSQEGEQGDGGNAHRCFAPHDARVDPYRCDQRRYGEREADVGDDRTNQASDGQLWGMTQRGEGRDDQLGDTGPEAAHESTDDSRPHPKDAGDAGEGDDELTACKRQHHQADDQAGYVECHDGTLGGNQGESPTLLPGTPIISGIVALYRCRSAPSETHRLAMATVHSLAARSIGEPRRWDTRSASQRIGGRQYARSRLGVPRTMNDRPAWANVVGRRSRVARRQLPAHLNRSFVLCRD